MRAVNEKEYQALKDRQVNDYSKAAIRYAERWAELMEKSISEGANVLDIANETSLEVDTDNISGAAFFAALNMLMKHWIFGSELRKWKEKEYGLE